MTTFRAPRAAKPQTWPAESAKLQAFELANAAINSAIRTLSTADKNRVLLALHAQIGEQLDSLAADNNQ